MKKPKELLRSRSFRAGGYSVLVCALALAIAVSLNYLAGTLPQGLTHRDVTQAGLFTLSPQTESLLQGLGEDVTVYWVVQSGQEDAGLEQLLQNYQAGSPHFVVEKRDPDLYPTFLEDYGVSPFYNNSLLVTLGSRYRYVGYYDIYPYDTEAQSFAGEQKLTAALQFVTSPSLPKIYFTTGHGEESLPEDFSQALEGANFSSETISLLSAMSVPEDAAALAILGPEKDFDEQELEAVEEYLMNGGSLLYLSDPMDRRPQKLEALLSAWGLTAQEGVVVEGSSNYFALATPYYLMPDLESHAITDPLSTGGYYVLLPIAHGLTVTQATDLTTEVLLRTSARAYSKIDGLNAGTTQRETGDLSGPFPLAAASERSLDEGLSSRVVWVGSVGLINTQANSRVSGGNQDFFVNALSWLANQEEGITIHAKSLENQYLTLSDGTAQVLAAVFLAVIPGAFLAVGLSVNVGRKRR